MRRLIVTSTLMLAGFLTMTAEAGSIRKYTDRTVFDRATTTTLEDFGDTYHDSIMSGILNDQTSESGILPGDIQPGVTYSTPISTAYNFNIDEAAGFSGGCLDRVSGDVVADLTIEFDDPMTAFGFDTNSLMGTQFTYVITFTDGSTDAGTLSVADSLDMQFFGFRSTAQDIESVAIRGNDPDFSFIIDNFAFGVERQTGPVVPVPALSAYGLMLTFIGLLFLARRRLKNKPGRLV